MTVPLLPFFLKVLDSTSLMDDYSICCFPEHKAFVRICRQAESEAKRSGEKTNYWWRGYRGVVAANLPPITLPGLELRLLTALSKATDLTVPETMVKMVKNKCIISTITYICFALKF